MLEDFYNKHYISTSADGTIIDAWSDGPHRDKDTQNAICINDHGGYQFRLYIFYPWLNSHMRTEENPDICTMDGIPLYKWDGSHIIPRTEEEISADRAAIPEPPPSPQEQLRADVDFLLALGGVM